jgi:hypothetical protein
MRSAGRPATMEIARRIWAMSRWNTRKLENDVGDARQIQTADPVLRRHLLCPLSYRAMVVDAQARFELARWKPRWFCRPVPSATWLLRVMFNGADRRDRTGLLGLEGRCLTTRPDPR